ncbi:MAG TPA: ATPase [Flavobacteriales bacterium]|nr:ATPase [Flavobacteriales bacterium]
MKIAVIGPESSGKSKLSEQISVKLGIPLVKEYAREYLENLDGEYGENDLTKIAKGQYLACMRTEKGDGFISDTELLSIKIWSKEKYQKVDQDILYLMDELTIDLYLLCYPDLPWESDPLRESPLLQDRMRQFSWFVKELNKMNKPYRVIRGEGPARLDLAMKEIRSFSL